MMLGMQWLRRTPVLRTVVHSPPMRPTYAPLIECIASFGLGDPIRGHALAARAMLESGTDSDAIRALLHMLPSRTTAWPMLTRTSNDVPSLSERVLAVAQRWQPSSRLFVALYVLGNIERDELNQWSGTTWAAGRVADCIDEVGSALNLLPVASTSIGCISIAANLIDANHPELGRPVRLHALGCVACRDRLNALQTIIRLLRTTVQQHFALPPDMLAVTAAHPSRPTFQWTTTARIATLVMVIATLFIGVTGLTTPSPQTSTPLLSVDVVLERALNRFDAPHTDGVLHERYQVSTGIHLGIERYVDWKQEQLRVKVTRTDDRQPVLDLVAAGQRLRYTLWNDGKPETTAVDNPRVRELMPLLRMLPEGGAVRSYPAMHNGMDFDFLSTARRTGTTLLGTTTVNQRSAYLLSYHEPEEHEQIVLAIDAATYALLRASNTGIGARARSDVLWQATAIELLEEAPPRTFDTSAETYQNGLPNPRHLMFGAFSNIALDDVSSYYGLMPVPATIPTGTTLSYLREDNRIGVMQLYEGPRSTVAFITAAPPLPSISLRKLSFRTGDTYWDIVSDDADVTHIEFIRNSDPTHRSHLYVWHATMSATERRAFAVSVIMSIKWIAMGSGGAVGQRFEDLLSTTTR